MFLLDINVWLALAFEAHTMHRSAVDWFEGTGIDSCWFSRLTQLGFLRLAVNPSAVGNEALNMQEAWQAYMHFRNDLRVGFLDEPEQIDETFFRYTQQSTRSPKLWNDAYLAAFAKEHALKVVTFDIGFSQFPNLEMIRLK